MGLSDVRILRVLLQVALTALSLAVIGLSMKGSNQLADDRRKLEELLPGGGLQARSLVGVGIALVFTCIMICVMAFLNSIYIVKDRVPQAIRKRCPQGFSSKSMTLILCLLTPINIAQSALTASHSARASSTILPGAAVEELVRLSGHSLQYRDIVVIVDYTVISWIIWLLLVVGICIELSKYSSVQYGDNEKDKPGK